jgi:hypothetical protein
MNNSAFVELEFFLLVIFSVVLPFGIYLYLMWKKAISRYTVFAFGIILVMIGGVNVFLLRRLSDIARLSPSLMDDTVFRSELSIALYVIPAVFAGIGVNLISHLLINHLNEAENRFDHGRRK